MSDKFAAAGNLNNRVTLLFVLMLGEGAGLLMFANAGSAALAIGAMLVFGLFTHMACGATYAVVPFVDKRALGGVAGIIGAGGNVGAVAAGFLMKGLGDTQRTLSILGVVVAAIGAVRAGRAIRQQRRRRNRNPHQARSLKEQDHENYRYRPRHVGHKFLESLANSGASHLKVTVLCEEPRPALRPRAPVRVLLR